MTALSERTLLERFPIGSRWTDEDGDEHVVLTCGSSTVTTAFLHPTQGWMVDTWHSIYEEFTPYVEPEPLPEFTHRGWVHPSTKTIRSGYGEGVELNGVGKTFEYGVEGNELFIRWCAAEGGA